MVKPIISTCVGSVPEMIEHGESGIIIEVDDSEALSDAIIMMIDNPAERQKLGRNAAKRFQDKLSIGVFAEKFADIVERRLGFLT